MRTFRWILVSVWLAACTNSDEIGPNEASILESEVKLINNLAVDGCDWHFAARTGSEVKYYVPSISTKPKVEAIIKEAKSLNGLYEIDVILQYQLTNKTQKIRCGWGKVLDYDEIDVQEIKKK